MYIVILFFRHCTHQCNLFQVKRYCFPGWIVFYECNGLWL